MAIPEECLELVLSSLDESSELLNAAATSNGWRSASANSDFWQQTFISFLSRRQKPGFTRKTWQSLVDNGIVEPAGLSINACFSPLLDRVEVKCLKRPNEADTSSWRSLFIEAALDMRRRTVPTTEELCYDVCYDQRAGKNFPRSWNVNFELEGLGDEVLFQPDGTIKSPVGWVWQWRYVEDADQAAPFYPHLELTSEGTNYGLLSEPGLTIQFQCHRSADAGFVLVSPKGIKIWSQEKTIEEHIFRRYGGEPVCPRFVKHALEEIALKYINVDLPAELSPFERVCAELLAQRLGLGHQYSGDAWARHVKVSGGQLRDPRLQARVGKQGIEWPCSRLVLAKTSPSQVQQQLQRQPQLVQLIQQQQPPRHHHDQQQVQQLPWCQFALAQGNCPPITYSCNRNGVSSHK